MNFEYSPYILPLLVAAAVSIFVATYTLRYRSLSGAPALGLMAAAIAEWSIGYALEISSPNLDVMYIFGVSQYLGIAFVPYAWLIFAIDFSGHSNVLTRRFLTLMAVVPALTVLAAWTTKWHGLLWKTYQISVSEGFSALSTVKGAWFWIHTAYSYLLLLIGAILVLRVFWRRKGMYRGQVIAVLIAVLTPWLDNVLYLSGYSPVPFLDLTPFSFTVTVAAIAWAIFGFHLVDVAPIARDLVVDSLQEGVIVLDARGRIADLNASAARMFGAPLAQILGSPAEELFFPWPQLSDRIHDLKDWMQAFSVGSGESQIRYEASASRINDSRGRLAGKVIIVRKVDVQSGQWIPRPHAAPLQRADETTAGAEEHVAGEPPQDAPPHASWLDRLVTFFIVPVRTDLPVPANTSAEWYLTRERSFTLILRIGALVGTIAYVSSFFFLRAPVLLSLAMLIFGLAILLLWVMGIARNYDFNLRANVFLFLLYAIAVNETISYGYTSEGFIFFAAFVVISTLLTGRPGVRYSLGISALTLGVFAVLVGGKYFIPLNSRGMVEPFSVGAGLTTTIVFFAVGLAVAGATLVLMENLNFAWQKEAQALNLLQQERDLLEERVYERTRSLQEAESKQRALAEQLQESETRFRQIVENASDIIYRTDFNGNFTYINPSALSIMRYKSTEEVLGMNYLEVVAPEARQRVKRRLVHQAAAKIHNTYQEFPVVTAAGTVLWIGQNVQIILKDGQVVGFQALARDITELHQTQEALHLARDQALEASRFKDQLVSRVSHELRTPLGVIIGYAELLQQNAFGPLVESQRKAVDNVIESAYFLTDTVNDLLDQAQIESRSISLRYAYFVPSSLLEKIETNMSVLAKKKKLEFRTELAADMPSEIYGDEARLQQIILNLAGNAVKFTKEGFVSVRMASPAPARWSVEVRDTGTGISASDRERIFEPFHQVSSAITRENRGSGLGLAIVKQLVELMHGEISMQSEPGRGSIFTVTFPIIQAVGE